MRRRPCTSSGDRLRSSDRRPRIPSSLRRKSLRSEPPAAASGSVERALARIERADSRRPRKTSGCGISRRASGSARQGKGGAEGGPSAVPLRCDRVMRERARAEYERAGRAPAEEDEWPSTPRGRSRTSRSSKAAPRQGQLRLRARATLQQAQGERPALVAGDLTPAFHPPPALEQAVPARGLRQPSRRRQPAGATVRLLQWRPSSTSPDARAADRRRVLPPARYVIVSQNPMGGARRAEPGPRRSRPRRSLDRRSGGSGVWPGSRWWHGRQGSATVLGAS